MATPEFRRTEFISQSSTFAQFLRAGTPCMTAEHLFGSKHLGMVAIINEPAFRELCPELPVSLQLHDVGTPPGRHLADKYMYLMLGFGHEGRTTNIIMDSPLGDELERQGYDRAAICANIQNKSYPGGYLTAGGIDLDSLDNVKRYSDSMGIFEPGWEQDFFGNRWYASGSIEYSPEAYVRALRWHEGKVVLHEDGIPHLLGYQRCRSATYAYVDGELNRGVQTPLVLALDEAYLADELPPEFFDMTDYEAVQHLKRCNPVTKTIIERLEGRDFYYPVEGVSMITSCTLPGDPFKPEGLESLRDNPWATRELAQALSKQLGKPLEDVCIFLQYGDKGYRESDIPILTKDGELVPAPPSPVEYRFTYRIGAYLYGEPTPAECEATQAFLSHVTLN
ncbi:MAG TPA: hypothetical protein VLA04_01655 [Verrucomicrobiae bacterium]|nr:hypothetical protein [Verrucomicrobiae bacterium]